MSVITLDICVGKPFLGEGLAATVIHFFSLSRNDSLFCLNRESMVGLLRGFAQVSLLPLAAQVSLMLSDPFSSPYGSLLSDF